MTASPVAVPRSVTSGNEHDLLVVDSDEQLLAAATAYLGDGAAAGDLVRAVLPGWLVEQLAPTLPDVTFQATETAAHPREPDLIAFVRRTAAECAPRRLRLMALVTAPGGRWWDERGRCEAITNIAYAGSAVSILCVYDRRTAPATALATAAATHPHLHTPQLRRPNPRYQDPAQFMAAMPVPEEPLQATPPVLAVDAAPSLPELRHAVSAALRGRAGDRDVEEDFHLAVSEIAANAFRHGTPPVSARLWASADRLVCTITDAGTGYRDATAGYRPAHGDDLSRGGMGLWLARKLCDHVDLVQGPQGLTVRLVVALR